MNTEEIMALALRLAGLSEVPADSQIYYPGERIKKILIGLDLGSAELQLAKSLGFDLAIAHHPQGGRASLNFAEVLKNHIRQMVQAGVPREIAEAAIQERLFEARVSAHMSNYDHALSIARLLGLPFMNIHTPLDEIGRQRLAEVVGRAHPELSLLELVGLLKESLPEFRHAQTEIDIRVGQPQNMIGRTVVSHGAGTNGGYPVAKAYFEHGVDTVIYIHCSPGDSKRLREEFQEKGKNLIVTGHIASDSLGINPFIAELLRRGLEVVPISGIVPG
ncbi:MAG: Nif3-like dinuclear metal center hexameric protein [Candidatus Acetothermia bacterium]|jgi:putative NIF3 family GTP cyclohydrolase 1 type 2|nr:Nif3-like dinuclear metal center hexameric protein [Candidatus Acetothermia bacterium]MDH7505679.1 Nif3-like dinuclear metal center hexameric protein [Candidatus Acetothermia bacterium]